MKGTTNKLTLQYAWLNKFTGICGKYPSDRKSWERDV